ncbi:hypothetical protein DICPUDRAFT_155430 [Dictyostelium purpureum]|uniref:ADF-H domain-containing protein n=1 Tax=Dictyostelium purpureum TaxID=5786 RepID=F0ZU00_DICPU|nr:uncharacterized protein DICPUDRAFT_155430 [Dictyostelium purpureum]EGC32593.1 hypothetical protein DICPUDRAFT_155430 [Dictyostelium purpureum]|eukprot:XP_003290884.1 hypothetical protein DICPUDRAFT_155430 [Dictyostelium purpureum]
METAANQYYRQYKEKCFSYIVYKINKKEKKIFVEYELPNDANFDQLCSTLPNSSCRYITHFNGNTIFLIIWTPESTIKEKMLYLSSTSPFIITHPATTLRTTTFSELRMQCENMEI